MGLGQTKGPASQCACGMHLTKKLPFSKLPFSFFPIGIWAGRHACVKCCTRRANMRRLNSPSIDMSIVLVHGWFHVILVDKYWVELRDQDFCRGCSVRTFALSVFVFSSLVFLSIGRP